MPLCIFFSDDSRQAHPTRPGMYNLIATGSIRLPVENVQNVEQLINAECDKVGFPKRQEFKWSPGRELWMHDNLLRDERKSFFERIIHILAENFSIINVVIEDIQYRPTKVGMNHEMDSTNLLIERIERQCERTESQAIVITDRPGGDRAEEEKFLGSCLETLQQGTNYITPTHIIHNVLSTSSHLSRCIQAADLITGCTLAFVSGENIYSPEIFHLIIPLLDNADGRIGGIGLKIHPDGRYVNLYHWLVNDKHCLGWGNQLPVPSRPYNIGPNTL